MNRHRIVKLSTGKIQTDVEVRRDKLGESSQVWIHWLHENGAVQTAVVNVRLLPGDKYPRVSLDTPGAKWIEEASKIKVRR